MMTKSRKNLYLVIGAFFTITDSRNNEFQHCIIEQAHPPLKMIQNRGVKHYPVSRTRSVSSFSILHVMHVSQIRCKGLWRMHWLETHEICGIYSAIDIRSTYRPRFAQVMYYDDQIAEKPLPGNWCPLPYNWIGQKWFLSFGYFSSDSVFENEEGKRCQTRHQVS
jgi:hypothetical protein